MRQAEGGFEGARPAASCGIEEGTERRSDRNRSMARRHFEIPLLDVRISSEQ